MTASPRIRIATRIASIGLLLTALVMCVRVVLDLTLRLLFGLAWVPQLLEVVGLFMCSMALIWVVVNTTAKPNEGDDEDKKRQEVM